MYKHGYLIIPGIIDINKHNKGFNNQSALPVIPKFQNEHGEWQ
jgi:hypothetical protein